ncbi:MAG: signal peptidase I, partial [Nitrospirota bacterium]
FRIFKTVQYISEATLLVQVQTGHLFLSESIKGKKHQVMLTPSIISLNSFKPITIPDGKYFMMGDNRDNSKDSRFFGPVDRKLIVGQATNVVISRDESFLSPRWKRFFQKLM